LQLILERVPIEILRRDVLRKVDEFRKFEARVQPDPGELLIASASKKMQSFFEVQNVKDALSIRLPSDTFAIPFRTRSN
jgi:hypothetical protein